MMVAQSIFSEESGVVASLPNPAESVSTLGHDANICSAVGLRNRFCVQIKSARFILL